MPRSERLDVVMLRLAPLNADKEGGRLSDRDTLHAYKKHILRFCDWAKELGIKREHDIEKNGYTNVTLIQKYADELVASGLRPTSVHTYLAPVCKGLGVGMHEIRKPSRNSADIQKNALKHQNPVGARQLKDPRFARIRRLGELTGVRPSELKKLNANCLLVDEFGDNMIRVRGKGGKISLQYLLPHEAEMVKELLSKDAEGNPIPPNKSPFTKKDLGKISWNYARDKRAQEIEQYYSLRFNAWKTMPSKTPAERKRRAAAKAAAEAEKKMWIDKIVYKYRQEHPMATVADVEKYRKQLENPAPISIRGGNRERAIALGRPTEYDRVAVRIASVYALSHWVDESTIRNYLTK